jgi:hypothetical protein
MKRLSWIKYITLCGVLTFVGCASTDNRDQLTPERSESLYLRGSFTWFDAEPDYQVVEVSTNIYKTTIDLVADGQAYEFKFADDNWSKGNNCGYANKEQDQVVDLVQKVTANCLAVDEFFLFTPQESGKYDFYIDFNESEQNPTVWIQAYEPTILDNIVEPIQNVITD